MRPKLENKPVYSTVIWKNKVLTSTQEEELKQQQKELKQQRQEFIDVCREIRSGSSSSGIFEIISMFTVIPMINPLLIVQKKTVGDLINFLEGRAKTAPSVKSLEALLLDIPIKTKLKPYEEYWPDNLKEALSNIERPVVVASAALN